MVVIKQGDKMKETPKQFFTKVEKKRERLRKKYHELRNCGVTAAHAAQLMHRTDAFIKEYLETFRKENKK